MLISSVLNIQSHPSLQKRILRVPLAGVCIHDTNPILVWIRRLRPLSSNAVEPQRDEKHNTMSSLCLIMVGQLDIRIDTPMMLLSYMIYPLWNFLPQQFITEHSVLGLPRLRPIGRFK